MLLRRQQHPEKFNETVFRSTTIIKNQLIASNNFPTHGNKLKTPAKQVLKRILSYIRELAANMVVSPLSAWESGKFRADLMLTKFYPLSSAWVRRSLSLAVE